MLACRAPFVGIVIAVVVLCAETVALLAYRDSKVELVDEVRENRPKHAVDDLRELAARAAERERMAAFEAELGTLERLVALEAELGHLVPRAPLPEYMCGTMRRQYAMERLEQLETLKRAGSASNPRAR